MEAVIRELCRTLKKLAADELPAIYLGAMKLAHARCQPSGALPDDADEGESCRLAAVATAGLLHRRWRCRHSSTATALLFPRLFTPRPAAPLPYPHAPCVQRSGMCGTSESRSGCCRW